MNKSQRMLAGFLAAFLLATTGAYGAELNLPALEDQAVPANIKPSLAYAKTDRPKPYVDRCHVQQNLTSSPVSCIYGDKSSKTTIVLFGDSHALSWFPAIEKLAIVKHWKLISLTMSSCWPADIPAYNSVKKYLMENCGIWRSSAIASIAQIEPALTFVAGTRGFATLNDEGDVATGEERTKIWEEGIYSTLSAITSVSDKVVYLGDIPFSSFDVPVCLQKNLDSIEACSTPAKKAIDSDWLVAEAQAASDAGDIFMDPTNWICKSDPCSPIDGKKLIYLDAGHLTATFAATLEKPLWTSLSSAG